MAKRSLEMELEAFEDNLWVDTETGCYEWTGGKATNGYGIFHADGKAVLAHRYSWESVNGPIPDGLCVLHSCDNRGCQNAIEHMFLGNKKDNSQDMVAKGRAGCGPGTSFNRTTPEERHHMAYLRAHGASWYSIAKLLGYAQQTVKRAVEKYINSNEPIIALAEAV
jgi:HNH endonuclease